MSFHFYQDITPPPPRGLTDQQIRDACAYLSQRANGATELLRRAHKLLLIIVRSGGATHRGRALGERNEGTGVSDAGARSGATGTQPGPIPRTGAQPRPCPPKRQ